MDVGKIRRMEHGIDHVEGEFGHGRANLLEGLEGRIWVEDVDDEDRKKGNHEERSETHGQLDDLTHQGERKCDGAFDDDVDGRYSLGGFRTEQRLVLRR